MTRRHCRSCSGHKLPTDYNRDARTHDGLRSICRACQRASDRRSRRVDGDALRARERLAQQRYVTRHPRRRAMIAAESRRRCARVTA